jgi:hypothetical protein
MNNERGQVGVAAHAPDLAGDRRLAGDRGRREPSPDEPVAGTGAVSNLDPRRHGSRSTYRVRSMSSISSADASRIGLLGGGLSSRPNSSEPADADQAQGVRRAGELVDRRRELLGSGQASQAKVAPASSTPVSAPRSTWYPSGVVIGQGNGKVRQVLVRAGCAWSSLGGRVPRGALLRRWAPQRAPSHPPTGLPAVRRTTPLSHSAQRKRRSSHRHRPERAFQSTSPRPDLQKRL